MRTPIFVLLFVLALCPRAFAQAYPDVASCKEGREVIADLGRIVAPSGIQESYKVCIGGIEQWINVRGQDSTNPVVLFAHGVPLTPTIWQFQRWRGSMRTEPRRDHRDAACSASMGSIAATVSARVRDRRHFRFTPSVPTTISTSPAPCSRPSACP